MTELSCPDCKAKITLKIELTEEPKEVSCSECMSDLRVSKTNDEVKVRSIDDAKMLGVLKKKEGYSDSTYGEYD